MNNDAYRCPECHMWNLRNTHPYRPGHYPKCSQVTVHDLQYWLQDEKDRSGRRLDLLRRQMQETSLWQGKYRIVKHENNQLRKRLFSKSTNQP